MEFNLIKHNALLVQLFELEKITKTEGGILLTAQENFTSDGGKFGAKQSLVMRQSAGEIIAISPSAQKYCTESLLLETSLQVGDQVYIDPRSATAQNEFVIDRENSVAGGHGIVEINVGNIQTIIKKAA